MMPGPLIMAARRLAEVLEHENTALRAMDLRLAATYLPEKTAAVAGLLAAGKAAPGTSHPDLVRSARRLESSTLENRLLLERAINAQKRVIGIVAGAAAAAVTGAGPAYGSGGRMARYSGPMALSTRA